MHEFVPTTGFSSVYFDNNFVYKTMNTHAQKKLGSLKLAARILFLVGNNFK